MNDILWWMKGYCSSALYPFKVQCCTTSLKRLSLWSSILNLTSVRPLFLYTLPWSPPFWTLNATMTPHYFKSKKFNSLLTKSPVIFWSHNNSSHFSMLELSRVTEAQFATKHRLWEKFVSQKSKLINKIQTMTKLCFSYLIIVRIMNQES